jgi:uncharacterized protein YigE (DUF2233 family)
MLKGQSIVYVVILSITFSGYSHAQAFPLDSLYQLREQLVQSYLDSLESNSGRLLRSQLNWSKTSQEAFDSLRDFQEELFEVMSKDFSKKSKEIEEQLKEQQSLVSTDKGYFNYTFKANRIRCFKLDLDSEEIMLHIPNVKKQEGNTISEVIEFMKSSNKTLLMATNAGMFTPNFEPEGYYKDSTQTFPTDTGYVKDLNFYLQPNGVFFMDINKKPHILTTQEFGVFCEKNAEQITIGTQSGPMLVYPVNNKSIINPQFRKGSPNKKIRSCVTLTQKGEVIFCISDGQMNFFDFAEFSQIILQAEYALFLDGAISAMYTPGGSKKDLNSRYGPIISISKKD